MPSLGTLSLFPVSSVCVASSQIIFTAFSNCMPPNGFSNSKGVFANVMKRFFVCLIIGLTDSLVMSWCVRVVSLFPPTPAVDDSDFIIPPWTSLSTICASS